MKAFSAHDAWQLRTLGDLVMLQRGIDLPEDVRRVGMVPVMGSFGITGRHDEAACRGPGVTVGRSGASIGVVSYIERDYWPLNTCLYVRDFKGNHPRFVYYLLKTLDLRRYNSGSAQPSLNRNFLHPLSLAFPGVDEQKAIASVLGTLDDKIELNRRMNETLEAMARAIFKDWFVDFGPTRAKMEGRAPYLAADIWSLFPGRLDDDGKPEGWRSFRLEDLAVHHREGITPFTAPDADFEHYSLPAYDAGQTPLVEPGRNIKSNKTLVPQNAILLSKLNPEIERVWLPNGRGQHEQISSTEFLIFTPRNGIGRAFVYGVFRERRFRAMLQSMVTGTSKSHQRVSPGALLAREVVVGCADVFTSYTEFSEPILDRVLSNRLESLALAGTRDLLLPKLMSGEVRVKEAEKIVGEAT